MRTEIIRPVSTQSKLTPFSHVRKARRLRQQCASSPRTAGGERFTPD